MVQGLCLRACGCGAEAGNQGEKGLWGNSCSAPEAPESKSYIREVQCTEQVLLENGISEGEQVPVQDPGREEHQDEGQPEDDH